MMASKIKVTVKIKSDTIVSKAHNNFKSDNLAHIPDPSTARFSD